MPCRMNSRLMVLMAASCPSQMGTAVRMRIGPLFFIAPDHADIRGVRAADVEGQIMLCIRNLPFARALRQMQVRLDDLPDTRRAHGMAVADQAAAGIDERRPAFLQ